MRMYTVCLSASDDKAIHFAVTLVGAASIEEAQSAGDRLATQIYPPDEGWRGHRAVASLFGSEIAPRPDPYFGYTPAWAQNLERMQESREATVRALDMVGRLKQLLIEEPGSAEDFMKTMGAKATLVYGSCWLFWWPEGKRWRVERYADGGSLDFTDLRNALRYVATLAD